jgi:hypothetical protein
MVYIVITFLVIAISYVFIISWFFPKRLMIEVKNMAERQKKFSFYIPSSWIDRMSFKDDPDAQKWFFRIWFTIGELLVLLILWQFIGK